MNNDKTLLSFLKHWIEWVEAGAPDNEPFSRSKGLCPNARKFGGFATGTELANHLIKTLDNCLFPFDGYIDYITRRELGTQHECPKRLAWVRKTIKELERTNEE